MNEAPQRMTSDLYLVFSRPADDVPDAEFNEWYDQHLVEILATPGFESVQRFRLTPVVLDESERPAYRYLVVWEIRGDIDVLRAALTERVSSGEMILPGWFKETQYMTWVCEPMGEKIHHSRTGELEGS